MNLPDQPTPRVVGYTLAGVRYLNVTNRCTLRCAFCPKFNGSWEVCGYDMRLDHEPSVDELVAAAGSPKEHPQVVFCGLGEPTLRLYAVLEAATCLRWQGRHVRLNTDGLANLVYRRDVTPDLEDCLDAISISLNAQDRLTYNRHCRPRDPTSYEKLHEFIVGACEFVPDVTLTAVDGLEGVDIDACARIAADYGAKFRRRVLGEIG